MGKKNFNKAINTQLEGGLDTLLGEIKQEQPVTPPAPVSRSGRVKTTQEGTYEGEIRATFIVKESKLETLKALVFWTPGAKQKDLINKAIDLLLQSYSPEHIEKAVSEYNNFKNSN